MLIRSAQKEAVRTILDEMRNAIDRPDTDDLVYIRSEIRDLFRRMMTELSDDKGWKPSAGEGGEEGIE